MPPRNETQHEHHGKRPEWWNGVSLGNLLTIVGGVIVASVAWGAMQTQMDAHDEKIETNNKAIAEAEQRQNEKVNSLRADLRRMEDKIDRLIERGR
jgi:seryl-tRNA synthetase